MKVTRFSKVGAGLAAGVSLSLCLGAVAANAAGTPVTANQEDPQASHIGTYTLVGVGSDTIQDVEYGVSQDLGTYDGTHLNLASWTATGTTPLSYRSGGVPAVATAHPNGSGAGYTALKESLGMIAPSGTDGVAPGDVDYSRASGFQDSNNEKFDGSGIVTEIPFAIDAISFAAPAGSPFLKTNGGLGLTLEDLANIYAGVDQYVDTVTGALSATATATTEPIQAFLPKPGSGSRQFFLTQLNKVNSAVPVKLDKGDAEFPAPYTSTSAPYVGSEMNTSHEQAQEHDATVLTSAPAGVAAIAPFSAAKFIGYHNGVIADPDAGKTAGTDYELIPFDNGSASVLPYTGDASTNATLTPNTGYKAPAGSVGAITREVFNLIPTAAVDNPNANVKYRALYDTFVGAGSKFCLDAKAILAYGFMTDANCGNPSRTAGVGSSATVTVTHTAAVAGKSTVVTVAVQSIGNAGGSVALTVNGKVYSATIAKGQTTAKFTVPTPKAGTISFGGGANDGFTPNLSGIYFASIAQGSITVAKATPTVKATAARVSHTVAGKAVVTVAATGLTPTGKVTVTIKKGTAIKATRIVSLVGGKATASLPKLPVGTYYVYVSYTGDANVNKTASTKLTTLAVF
ncbi:hypothetical protein LK09_10515 [Microbacterium mangrovi]|uniref:Uncharacterized protein n=1 Tax=Microbacterium mangrovi TaxID=1348253 RepID=A0A0B2A2A5_9MICO|nr:Ig-like domain repeat protein [Microbacterium mangrovi]KHK97634.1 hypothetical protein LK09_10515 [Microbacterium mangrovi]